MEEITEDKIRKLSSTQSYLKGSEYYKSGQVKSVNYENGGYSGIVSGTYDYQVKVTPTDNDIRFHCTCPYDFGGICKHCVALGLAIIDNTAEIMNLKKTESDDTGNVDELLESATAAEIKTFLKKILEESRPYRKTFETFLKGQTGVESDIDISEVRDDLIADLENFDLENYQRFYDYDGDNYGRYREEWAVLYEGARSELENLLSGAINNAKQELASGNVIDAFKMILALYEARFMVDETKIRDEVEIFWNGIGDEVDDFLNEILRNYEIYLMHAEIQPDAALRIIEILFDRIKRTEDDDFYHLKHLQSILLSIIVNKNVANKLLAALGKYSTDDAASDEIQLKIAAILEDKKQWKALANRFFPNNPTIAHQLLNHYKQVQNDAEYRRVAEVAFRKWPDKFDREIYSYLKTKQKSEFLAQVLIHFTIRTERLDLFRELKDKYGPSAVDQLIAAVQDQYGKQKFYIKILTELKNYAAILEYLQKNIRSDSIDYMIDPILNIYPRECFDLVKSKTEKYLEENIGRDYYRIAVHWLGLLKDIRDDSLMKDFQKYITSLYQKYNRRPALKDELSKAGLKE